MSVHAIGRAHAVPRRHDFSVQIAAGGKSSGSAGRDELRLRRSALPRDGQGYPYWNPPRRKGLLEGFSKKLDKKTVALWVGGSLAVAAVSVPATAAAFFGIAGITAAVMFGGMLGAQAISNSYDNWLASGRESWF